MPKVVIASHMITPKATPKVSHMAQCFFWPLVFFLRLLDSLFSTVASIIYIHAYTHIPFMQSIYQGQKGL